MPTSFFLLPIGPFRIRFSMLSRDFVALMTMILILSSVTMVLAVEAGHRMDKKDVQKWLLWTILFGTTFVSCQAWEWSHFITGSEHGMKLADGSVFYGANLQFNE